MGNLTLEEKKAISISEADIGLRTHDLNRSICGIDNFIHLSILELELDRLEEESDEL